MERENSIGFKRMIQGDGGPRATYGSSNQEGEFTPDNFRGDNAVPQLTEMDEAALRILSKSEGSLKIPELKKAIAAQGFEIKASMLPAMRVRINKAIGGEIVTLNGVHYSIDTDEARDRVAEVLAAGDDTSDDTPKSL